ncbi:bifunctional hydroxymethylpyrimidine kinase/phosphomethylpyrimidine kinase [Pseudophaeobacter profundi]|uniref:bifunctional hydroxymethylpyrimidine kinase/phosphomethylpyrimidine kinase n=1 Tax=Pseudophaeobacter profundi TaxID=3034152 RepID=UPI00242FE81D|nr:hydroxymethylpyrimidine/phosphomethylpyrimidine kinase [Pseudophaeobacter profundi]
MNRVLVIAGTDSSGGAGLSRDTAMATTLGCEVVPVVTAVTVQTNQALQAIHPVPPQIISAQIRAAFDDKRTAPRAVKIGMIGSAEAARLLADTLPEGLPIVLDPVLKSSSGGTLMSLDSLTPLLRRVTLLTPNLEESARLSGLTPMPRNTENQCISTQEPPQDDLVLFRRQAQIIQAKGVAAVLIKGGHADGDCSVDHLFSPQAPQGHRAYAAPRLPLQKRGTGCSLATALACSLAAGASLDQACTEAKAAVSAWLAQ